MKPSKIVALEDLAARVKNLRGGGKRVVATNGCFDLLHVGHVRYLASARALGDILIVGINGNQSVRELKGRNRPINNEHDRAEVLAALESVDLVAIFPELRATAFIKQAAPDIYVKGGDYKMETLNAEERAALEEVGSKIEIIPFEKGYSTSGLLERSRKTDK